MPRTINHLNDSNIFEAFVVVETVVVLVDKGVEGGNLNIDKVFQIGQTLFEVSRRLDGLNQQFWNQIKKTSINDKFTTMENMNTLGQGGPVIRLCKPIFMIWHPRYATLSSVEVNLVGQLVVNRRGCRPMWRLDPH